jgi:hypothetical protein
MKKALISILVISVACLAFSFAKVESKKVHTRPAVTIEKNIAGKAELKTEATTTSNQTVKKPVKKNWFKRKARGAVRRIKHLFKHK